MTRAVPAISGSILVCLLAASSYTGLPAVLAVVLLVVVMVAAGWPALLTLPTQRGSTTIVALCGAVTASVVAISPKDDPAQWLPASVALTVTVAFWHQLLRRDARQRLIESVTGVTAGALVVTTSSGWILVARQLDRSTFVLAATAIVVALGATLLRWPQRATWPLAIISSAAFALLANRFVTGVADFPAAMLGFLMALVVVTMDRLLNRLPSARSRQAGMVVGASMVASAGALVPLWAFVFV